jgi:MYXO-CTERM domain-containing protein
MSNPITETAKWEQATSLYTVAGSALIIFLLLLLALLLAWRRRRKKKPQQFPVKELDA